MMFVPVLTLPDVMPTDEAIQSWGQNHHDYEPEFWEFQYQVNRYLERVPDYELNNRYVGILKNMRAIVSRDRHVIPLNTFLSLWYWYRKEHQTRFEFHLRGIELPTPPPDGLLDNLQPNAPARPRHPNASDIIFRYLKRRWAEAMVNKGTVRLTPALTYGDSEMNAARKDEELEKTSYMPGQHVRITTQGGTEMPVIGNVARTVSAPDYYVLSMSCDWDNGLFDDFNSDACVIIHAPNDFADRLSRVANTQLNGWYFHHNPLNYFDPYERVLNQRHDAGMWKDFRYAYQREYRFLWMPLRGENTTGYIDLELGVLDGIAEVHRKGTVKLSPDPADSFHE